MPVTVESHTLASDALVRIVRQAMLTRLGDRISERAGTGLDRALAVILVQLEEAPQRVSDLAAGLGVDVSTTSRQLQALERLGLVERRRDPADRRASVLAINDDGRRTLAAHRVARRAVVAEVMQDWTVEDTESFGRLLHRFADDLERYASS
jgi:DNA-binding MarR family transcriptional regulator